MPIEKLQKQVIDDAWRRADAMKEDAQRQGDAVVKEAKSKARAMKEQADREAAEEIRLLEDEERENADLLERAAVLDARSRVIESLIPRIKSMAIGDIKRDDYKRFITSAIEQATAMTQGEKLTMIVQRSDVRLVKNFGGRIKFGEIGNGIALVSKNGKITVKATLEDLFDGNRRTIETLLTQEIFGRRHIQRHATKKAARRPGRAAKKSKAKKRKR